MEDGDEYEQVGASASMTSGQSAVENTRKPEQLRKKKDKEGRWKRERRARWRSASSGVLGRGAASDSRRSGQRRRSTSMSRSLSEFEEEKPGWNDRFWVNVAKDNSSFPLQMRQYFDSFGPPRWSVAFNESWRGFRRGGYDKYGTVKEEYDQIDNMLRDHVYRKPSLMADGFCQSNVNFDLRSVGLGVRRNSRLPQESESDSGSRSRSSTGLGPRGSFDMGSASIGSVGSMQSYSG